MAHDALELRKNALRKGPIPRHVAMIMDGNGRWAGKRKLPRISGHRAGIETVRRVVRFAGEMGIAYLTLYAFSSENWRRPKSEVSGLMHLLADSLKRELPELNENGVRIKTIGDISLLPKRSRDALAEAMTVTAGNTGVTLVLALNYGGRDEIVRAARGIADDVAAGTLPPDKVDAALFESYLDTGDMPDPDLLIRTSGEYRLSNFLLWQLAYTELWVTGVPWPDFSEDDFCGALESYGSRERRFGKTSQQLGSVIGAVAGLVASRKRDA